MNRSDHINSSKLASKLWFASSSQVRKILARLYVLQLYLLDMYFEISKE